MIIISRFILALRGADQRNQSLQSHFSCFEALEFRVSTCIDEFGGTTQPPERGYQELEFEANEEGDTAVVENVEVDRCARSNGAP